MHSAYDAFPDAKANYPGFSSMGGLSQRREDQREKMKMTSFSFQRKQLSFRTPN